MRENPLAKASLSGVVMQALMVAIGKFVPAIGAMPNFYAICGSVLAALTGAMAGRAMPGASSGAAASTGAIAGGATSIVGGLMAVATGQWPGFEMFQLLFPAISGAVAGGIGGAVTRMMAKKATA